MDQEQTHQEVELILRNNQVYSEGEHYQLVSGCSFVYLDFDKLKDNGQLGKDSQEIIRDRERIAMLMAEQIMEIDPDWQVDGVAGIGSFGEKLTVDVADAVGTLRGTGSLPLAVARRHKFPDEPEVQFNPMATFYQRRLVIVDDVGTSYKTSGELTEAIKRLGGQVAAIIVVVNRLGTVAAARLATGHPHTYALMNILAPSYQPDICPKCQANIPYHPHIGHGRSKK